MSEGHPLANTVICGCLHVTVISAVLKPTLVKDMALMSSL